MNKVILVLLALAIVASPSCKRSTPVSGASPEERRKIAELEAQLQRFSAVRRVMIANREAAVKANKKIDETKKTSTRIPVEVIANACDQLATEIRQIDLAGCPTDFAEAFVRYSGAMWLFATEAKSVPTTTWETIQSTIPHFLHGEADGGFTKMKQSYEQRSRNWQSAFSEVEAIAARHGVNLGDR